MCPYHKKQNGKVRNLVVNTQKTSDRCQGHLSVHPYLPPLVFSSYYVCEYVWDEVGTMLENSCGWRQWPWSVGKLNPNRWWTYSTLGILMAHALIACVTPVLISMQVGDKGSGTQNTEAGSAAWTDMSIDHAKHTVAKSYKVWAFPFYETYEGARNNTYQWRIIRGP